MPQYVLLTYIEVLGLVHVSFLHSFTKKNHRKTTNKIMDVVSGHSFHVLIANVLNFFVHLSNWQIIVLANNLSFSVIYGKFDIYCSYSLPTSSSLREAVRVLYHQWHYNSKADRRSRIKWQQVLRGNNEVKQKQDWSKWYQSRRFPLLLEKRFSTFSLNENAYMTEILDSGSRSDIGWSLVQKVLNRSTTFLIVGLWSSSICS